MNMKINEVQDSLLQLIEITLPLVNGNPVPQKGTDFLRVLEGLFRRNGVRLQAIHMLSRHPVTSNTALEVVRNMVEDTVGVDYMFANDKEKMAGKFFNYIDVQLFHELEYSKKLGIPIDNDQFPDTEKTILENYSKLSVR